MELPFIYKYKPTKFDEFEIEPEIIEILKTLISMDQLNILFIGDSGCGKSSLIYTLVKEYYKTTYKSENVLTINNLKEQGIQYYRNEVKIFCQSKSSIYGKKRVVILDDIDNINEQSQQVFRNCIDKYSHNVHFISSCSNIQKVIDSLQSRQIIIKLKPLNNTYFHKIIDRICRIEHLEMTTEAKQFIISVSNNSIRILINYLEKFKLLDSVIDLDIAKQTCTNIGFHFFDKYTNYALNKNRLESIKLIYDLFDKGYSVMDIYDNYFLYVKNTTLLTESIKYEVIKLLCKYITIFYNIHEDELELALFTNNLVEIISN
jgi:DNA polymerase III delta prime subunit